MFGMGAIEALSRGLNWLSFALAGLLLSAEQFGIYSISVAIFLIFSSLSSAGQDRVVLRYFKSIPEIIKSCFLISLLCSLGFLVVLGLFKHFNFIEIGTSFIFLSLWIVFSSQINIFTALARAREDVVGFFLMRALSTSFKFSAIILIALTSATATHLVILESILSALIFIIGVTYFKSNFKHKIVEQHFLKAKRFGIPFILHIAAGVTLGHIDKIMLSKSISNELIAQYSFLNALAGGSFFIYALLNIKYETKIYQYTDPIKVEKLLSFITKRSFLWAFLTLSILNIFVPSILDVINKTQLNNPMVLATLSVAYLIYPLYLQSNIRFAWHEKTQSIPLLTVIAALTNIGLNLLLIPVFGILGAAISTLVSYCVLCFSTQIVSRRISK